MRVRWAELTGYVQATAIGEAVSSLVEMLEAKKVRKMILGDNAAAIRIITTPARAWRSRRLKCRAGKLTELRRTGGRDIFQDSFWAADGVAKTQFERRWGWQGWLVVDKLKAVLGMLSLAVGAMAEHVVEREEEAIPVKLILTVVAVLAVVVWEITKKACGTKVKKVKGPVEEPSQEKQRPQAEARTEFEGSGQGFLGRRTAGSQETRDQERTGRTTGLAGAGQSPRMKIWW